MALALLLGLSLALHFMLGFTGDKNWLLLATRMMLSGKRLYVDIAETNPPLILWIYALPVWLAMHVGFIRDYQALILLAYAAVGAVAYLCVRLLRYHPVFAADPDKIPDFLALFALVFVVLTSPVYFFDRDDIALLLTLPYMLRFMPSLARVALPSGIRGAVGLLAAIGFCLKPHCVIVWAGVQLLVIWRERSPRIGFTFENSIVYAVGIGYLLAVFRFTPEYISYILPMLLATYSGYYRPGTALFFLLGAGFTFAVTFIDFRLRHTSPFRRDIVYVMGLCFCWLCYALLGNGWGYTYNPLISMLQLLCGWVWWEYNYLAKEFATQGLPTRAFTQGTRACLFNFAAAAVASTMIFIHSSNWQCDVRHECGDINEIAGIMRARHVTGFGSLVMDFHMNARIAEATGAALQTRFHHLWMLPQVIRRGPQFTSTHRWLLEEVSHGLAEDLNRNRPQIVIVDNSPLFYSTGQYVDIPALLERYADFAGAWSHYRLLHTTNTCPSGGQGSSCRFDMYERTGEK